MFKLVKEIRSKQGELHFKRWQIFHIPFTTIKLYLHLINKADEDLHEHDHPWSFISVILKGGYAEVSEHKITRRTVGSIAYKKASTTHKVINLFGKTYSLALVWGERRDWGYDLGEHQWMEASAYRKLKNDKS